MIMNLYILILQTQIYDEKKIPVFMIGAGRIDLNLNLIKKE